MRQLDESLVQQVQGCWARPPPQTCELTLCNLYWVGLRFFNSFYFFMPYFFFAGRRMKGGGIVVLINITGVPDPDIGAVCISLPTGQRTWRRWWFLPSHLCCTTRSPSSSTTRTRLPPISTPVSAYFPPNQFSALLAVCAIYFTK